MRYLRALGALLPCLLALLPACDGCAPRAPQVAPGPAPEAHADPPFGTGGYLPMVHFRWEGAPDVHNLYPSAVRITPRVEKLEDGLRSCSGVVVAPRLILTAGHCFCRRRPSTAESLEFRVDGSACVETADVDVFVYEYGPSMPTPHIASLTSERHQGKVRPHPQLEVRSSAKGDIIASRSDLALIVLDTPVPAGFHPALPARTDVILHESLALVGFGYEETLGWLDDTRLVNMRKVSGHLDKAGDRFRLESSEASFFRGDSGGPCFRPSPQGPMLVGISTTGVGQEPTFISIQSYRSWLQEELERSLPPGHQ